MKKNVKKLTLVALASGMLLQFGCLGLNWKQLLWTTAITQANEFFLDNNGIFDLFGDDLAAN